MQREILSLHMMLWIWWVKVKNEAFFAEIEVGWRKILRRIFKFECKYVKSNVLTQDGYNLCAFLKPVTNVSFPQNGGNFCAI